MLVASPTAGASSPHRKLNAAGEDRRDCWAVAMVTTIRRETLNGRLHDGDASSSLDGTCTADGDQFERDTAMKPAAAVELNPKQVAPVGKGDAPRERTSPWIRWAVRRCSLFTLPNTVNEALRSSRKRQPHQFDTLSSRLTAARLKTPESRLPPEMIHPVLPPDGYSHFPPWSQLTTTPSSHLSTMDPSVRAWLTSDRSPPAGGR